MNYKEELLRHYKAEGMLPEDSEAPTLPEEQTVVVEDTIQTIRELFKSILQGQLFTLDEGLGAIIAILTKISTDIALVMPEFPKILHDNTIIVTKIDKAMIEKFLTNKEVSDA